MQITTWNVNGIRAALRKGVMEWIGEHNPEVLCLQEVRARREQVDAEAVAQLEVAYPFNAWNPAERGGYSGVATFGAVAPVETILGMGNADFDIEGRVIQTRYSAFRLFNIYFPNGGRDHERVPFKLDFYAFLLDLCDSLHEQGEQIVITGDFNTAHNEIDLRNPKENQNTTGFLPEERVWIDRYLEHGFVDAYRQLYPEKEEYTWWTYRMNARARNVGWRLDYFLVSEGLMASVQDVVVHDDVMGSDHCPVTMTLDA